MNLKPNESFDVVIGFDQMTVAVENPRHWEELKVADVHFDSRLQDHVEKTFIPYNWSPMAFIYKKTFFESDQWKKMGLSALLLPEFENSIALQDPRTSSPGLQLLFWSYLRNESKPLSFLKSLKKNTKVIAPSWSTSYGLFQKGQAKAAFSYLSSLAYHWGEKQDRSYQAIIDPQGHPAQVEFVGIPKTCRHCELAKSFVNFLLTPKAQDYLMKKNFMFPALASSLKGSFFEELPQVKVIGGNKIKNFIKQKAKLFTNWEHELL